MLFTSFSSCPCLRVSPVSPSPRLPAAGSPPPDPHRRIPFLGPDLPRLDGANRMNQHDNFQQQTVSNPDDEQHLCRHEYHDRSAPSKLARDHEAKPAADNVAERVDDRVTLVAESCGRFT